MNAILIAIDFETHLISKDEPAPKPVCLSYYFIDGQQEQVQSGIRVGSDIEYFLRIALENPNIHLIAHNMSFESTVIDRWYPDLRELLYKAFDDGRLICTKIYEQLLDNIRKKPLYSFDLATLVGNYFDVDIKEDKKNPDAWRLRYHELEDVPLKNWPEEAVKYSIDDSMWAYKIYMYQKEANLDINLSVKAEFWLNRTGNFGILVDIDRVKELEADLKSKLDPKYDLLCKVGLCKEVNGKFKKNVKIFKEYITANIEKLNYTPKGNLATSKEALELYLGNCTDGTVRDTLKTYLDIVKYEKMMTAFVFRLKQATETIPIRSQYNAVVSSGRTSSRTSSIYPSVNIQQMPRSIDDVKWDIRNCFIPRPGYKIVSIDYAGLELASTAYMLKKATGKKDMLSIINGGSVPTDMHSVLAYRLYNVKNKKEAVNYDFFIKNKKLPGFKEFRQLAKPINLGFPGGIGYDKMRSILAKDGLYPYLHVLKEATYEQGLQFEARKYRAMGYPVRVRRVAWDKFQLVKDELVALKQTLFNLYPDLEHFLKEGHKEYLTGDSKKVKNEFGEWEEEPMYSFEIDGFKRDWCMYTQVCNGLLMQSPAAIGAKKAFCKVARKYANSKEVHVLAFIHDEILLEVLDNEDIYAIIENIGAIMIDEMQSVLKGVRITIEAEAMDYWSKSGGFWSRTYWKDGKV